MKKKLELGCGNNPRIIEGYENFCIDIKIPSQVPNNVTYKKINLGFEKLPYPSNFFDLIQAFDVLEHIPKCVWIEDYTNEKPLIRYEPFIFLMNEVFRVLKHDELFIIETPHSADAFHRDPTHCNWLTSDWWHYFSKEDNLYYNQGLIQTNFKIVKKEYRKYLWKDDDISHIELKAIKKDDVLI